MDKKPKKYIEPSEFFEECLKSLKKGRASEELGRMFLKLCEKYANHPAFVRYHHIRDELISAGTIGCVKAFPSFKPMRNTLIRDTETDEILESIKNEWDGEIVPYDYKIHNNPFAFFTTCIQRELLQYLKKYYNERNVVNAVRLTHGLPADAGYIDMLKARGEDVSFHEVLNDDEDGIETDIFALDHDE